MSEQNPPAGPAIPTDAKPADDRPAVSPPPADPVRRWTFIVLAIAAGLQYRGGDTESECSTLATILQDVFDMLLARLGPQAWWPGESPLEVMVGAVLVQNTSWKNVEKAIENLRVVQNRYEAGSSANIEVLDAETLRQQALSNRDNARYELALAKIRLARAVGALR